MAGTTGPGGDLSGFLDDLAVIRRRLDTLERPTGSEKGNLVAQVQAAIANIGATVTAYLAGGFTTGSMTASGSVSVGGSLSVTGPANFPQAYANPVTTAYFAAYIDGDTGKRLGRTVSSRRYKQDVVAWTPDVQAVFALQLVQYRQIHVVAEMGDEAPVEWGLIAEELVDLGLDWLVLFVDGRPEGIAYEKIALALLPIVQDHETRLQALEVRGVLPLL